MLAVGARNALAPVLNVARDPRWGRVEEMYGEDPVLIGAIGTAYIQGLQSDDLSHGVGVAAAGKHFLGYALSEGGRNWAPVQLCPRELREVYAEPFATMIRDAGLATIQSLLTSRKKAGIHMEYPPFAFTVLLREMGLALRSLVRGTLHPVKAIGRGGIPEKVTHVKHEF